MRAINDRDVAMYLEKRRSRKVSRFVVTLVLTYLILCTTITLQQRSLMYFPDRSAFSPTTWGLFGVEPIRTVTSDGLTITSWYYAPRDPTKPTIAFLQGNAGHPGQRNYKVLPWMEAGYGVVMIGYRGYGANPGKPNEEGLYRDARSVLDALKEKGVTGQALVLYGESLGTGVAVQMATEYAISGLVLESPYSSTTDVGAWRYPFLPVRYLMWDRYESTDKIGNVHVPLLLMHGEADTTVPTAFGKKLFAAANEPKRGMFMPGLGHNTIYNGAVQEAVLQFFIKLPHDKIVDGRLAKDMSPTQ